MSFVLRSDARARVLMIAFGKVVTDDIFLAGFAAVKDFVNDHGPYHGITDFSQVESFQITNELLIQIGSMRSPAFPITMRRLIVASAPASLVAARIVQKLRSDTFARLEIIGTIEEACAMMKTNNSDLIEVPRPA
jgi:hypothetical protein